MENDDLKTTHSQQEGPPPLYEDEGAAVLEDIGRGAALKGRCYHYITHAFSHASNNTDP